MRVRIKFCGMTRIEDVRIAATLGVDAIGIVLTRHSPRFIGLQAATRLRAAVPPFVACVALFMNDTPEWIAQALAALQPDLLQFHGEESAAACACYDRPYLKAVAMGGGADPTAIVSAHPRAAGFVLDGHAAGEAGGSGRRFDWSQLPSSEPRHWILAGGLNSDNVGAAIRAARPWAVDVSSGIESAVGVKDAQAMRRFVQAVHTASGDSGVGE